MRIAVFGLGYVGTVTAACLSHLGHTVTGIDTNRAKLDMIALGTSPVAEPGVSEMLTRGVDENRIMTTGSVAEAVHASDISMICVGTPGRSSGGMETAYIEAACQQIGKALRDSKQDAHTVVIRSTALPGTAAAAAEILVSFSGRKLGQGVNIAVNPEFLREGQGVEDFLHPGLILVGADDEETGLQLLGLYEGIVALRLIESVRTAEMVKYANNSWHAAKVTFANEIGVVSKALDVDGRRVMEILCKDTKLNLSSAYLRPGFAFGGSCLPKDVRAITFAAKEANVSTPLLSSLLNSNAIHVQRAVDQLVRWEPRSIGFLGLAFKSGTDDLRESPVVDVAERVLGKGFSCLIHDPDIIPQDLIGQNRSFIFNEIPELQKLLVSNAGSLIDQCDVLVVSKSTPELDELLARRTSGSRLLDLTGVSAEAQARQPYEGVAW
jgi:GDP-mannose 6-dehydrogenase